MATFYGSRQPPEFAYTAPHGSMSDDSSVTLDYSGLDRALALQDEIAQTSNNKYQQLYGGNVAGSVGAGKRIRDLLTQLRPYAPGATERDPYQLAAPLVRPTHISERSSQSSGGSHYSEDGRMGAQPGIPQAPPDREDPLARWHHDMLLQNQREQQRRRLMEGEQGRQAADNVPRVQHLA